MSPASGNDIARFMTHKNRCPTQSSAITHTRLYSPMMITPSPIKAIQPKKSLTIERKILIIKKDDLQPEIAKPSTQAINQG